MLKTYASEKDKERKRNLLSKNVSSVDTYGHGTTGYMVKHGPNAGKILKHIKTEKKEI
tara:strand:- start:437 stop:610 length:174 start_codon:yes stop_codon:yes gene_type:complete